MDAVPPGPVCLRSELRVDRTARARLDGSPGRGRAAGVGRQHPGRSESGRARGQRPPGQGADRCPTASRRAGRRERGNGLATDVGGGRHAVGRLRQRGGTATGARRQPAPGAGGTGGARRRPWPAAAAAPDGERAAVHGRWRGRRPGCGLGAARARRAATAPRGLGRLGRRAGACRGVRAGGRAGPDLRLAARRARRSQQSRRRAARRAVRERDGRPRLADAPLARRRAGRSVHGAPGRRCCAPAHIRRAQHVGARLRPCERAHRPRLAPGPPRIGRATP